MATRVSDLPVLNKLTGGELILVKQANNNLATLPASEVNKNSIAENILASAQPLYSELGGWNTIHDVDGRIIQDPSGYVIQVTI